ncbi:MAG: Crp/Fnr family transcriptional regulator [Desulfobacterales bacterium]|jgi:CRP/FNR family transcriptional regulator|nr:Crp/Fnr family transcriptional regulator [Desulfobacterales bacterium]MRR09568.1 Crp/Fnr family transcriptional regulator [bacterium]
MAEAQGAFERNLKAGETLFTEGEQGNEMYLIRSGKVEISRSAGGQKKVLATLSEGSFLGEMAIVDDAPRSATAIAASDVSLLILDRAAFKAQLQENPMIEYLITSLVKRLRETNEQVKIMLQKDDVCRIAASLLAMGREKGAPDGSGVLVKGSFTQDSLADQVGVSKAKAAEIFEKLTKSGLVAFQPDGIRIPSVPDLEEFWRFATLKEKFKEM